jgi:hypothetical protein
MSTRRRAVRRSRRLQVQFWRHSDATPHVGYTTNISMTGMFIATNAPLPPGSRIRVEVVDRDRGFMVEGIVAHARKMSLELARLNQSGMGVRFLSVEELVRELIPSGFSGGEEIPVAAADPAPLPPPPAPTAPVPTAPAPVAAPPPPSEPPAPAALPRVKPPDQPPAAVEASGGSFAVRFFSVEDFLDVYQRDILQGGLFVSTLYPARLQETVSVELFPPGLFAEPVMVRARVVQRFEPNSGSARNLLSGMGLELMDLPALLERLEPAVQRLKGP